MDHTAFCFGSVCVTWHGIIMALAVLAAILAAVMFRSLQRKTPNAILLTSVLGLVLGLFFSRFVYWYCAFEQYDGLGDALTSFGEGGHSLAGAMLGVLLACVIVWRTGLASGFAQLLDCVVPAGLLGIAVGRLGGFFSADDKSKIIFDSPSLQRLPFSVEVVNSATGVSEWRFATFLFEAIAALVVFFVCLRIFSQIYPFDGGAPYYVLPDGAVALTGLSGFGCTQVVLESTRYDSLFLRSNGFISLMQMVGLVMILLPLVFYTVWASRSRNGIPKKPLRIWIICIALLGEAAYLEYYVQRHASAYAVCYAAMLMSLVIVAFFSWNLCRVCEITEEEEALR